MLCLTAKMFASLSAKLCEYKNPDTCQLGVSGF